MQTVSHTANSLAECTAMTALSARLFKNGKDLSVGVSMLHIYPTSNFAVQTAEVTSCGMQMTNCTPVLTPLYFFLISFASEDNWLTTAVSEAVSLPCKTQESVAYCFIYSRWFDGCREEQLVNWCWSFIHSCYSSL